MKGWSFAAALIACAAAMIAACTTSPTGRSQFMIISPGAAISQSAQAYVNTVGQLAKEQKLSTDQRVAKRVRDVTGRVVHVARQQYPATADWEWSVAIIDDPETVNAWCMAGGRMAVYTGLLEQLDLTDDELAHIMGHEAAHAIANHTAEQMSRAMATNAGLMAVGVATGGDEARMQGAALAAQLALQLPNSRTAETEADQIGTELAIRAGFDPDAVLSLWSKMAQVGGGRRPAEFLSTHPSPENRQARLAQLIGEYRELNPQGVKAPIYPVQIISEAR